MSWRTVILRNPGWKLLALFLGSLVWYFVNAGIEGRFTPFSRVSTTMFERPVSIMTSGQIPTAFEVSPPKVSVEVRGQREAMQRLSQADLVTYVDLSDVYTATEVQRPVKVNLPWEGLEVSVTPATVRILLLRKDGSDKPPRVELDLAP